MRRLRLARKGVQIGSMPHLIRTAAEATRVPDSVARRVVDGFLAAVKASTWELGRVVVPGFAVFHVRSRAERGVFSRGVDGERYEWRVPGADVVKVRGEGLEAAMRGPSLVSLGIVAGGIGVLGALWWDWKHPCLEYASHASTCGGGMTCMSFDGDGSCLFWDTDPEYPCTVTECVRRAP